MEQGVLDVFPVAEWVEEEEVHMAAVGVVRSLNLLPTVAVGVVEQFVSFGQEIPVNSHQPASVHHKQYTINNSKEYIIWA